MRLIHVILGLVSELIALSASIASADVIVGLNGGVFAYCDLRGCEQNISVKNIHFLLSPILNNYENGDVDSKKMLNDFNENVISNYVIRSVNIDRLGEITSLSLQVFHESDPYFEYYLVSCKEYSNCFDLGCESSVQCEHNNGDPASQFERLRRLRECKQRWDLFQFACRDCAQC